MTNTDQLFNNMLARYSKSIERDIKYRLSHARDIEYVYDELNKGLNFILDLVRADENRKGFIEAFLLHYKRGEPIEKIFTLLRKSYGEAEDVRAYKLIEEGGKEIALYISEEEKKLKALARNQREMLRYFVRYVAQTELKKCLPKILEEVKTTVGEKPSKPSITYNVKWTGKRDNKNEFVQLVYALHEAGLINNGKGEITKIVEALADVFNVNLGKQWQSNLSKSIHNVNRDYEAPIFKQLREAFNTYMYRKIEEKKRK